MTTERVEALLEELIAWMRFANRNALVTTLRDVLQDPRHLTIYERLDGSTQQSKLADEFNVSKQAISNLVGKWRRLGLILDRDGKATHIARPSDLGVDVPKSPTIK